MTPRGLSLVGLLIFIYFRSPFTFSLSLLVVYTVWTHRIYTSSPGFDKGRQLWPNVFPLSIFCVCWASAALSFDLLMTLYQPTRHAFHYRRRIPVSSGKDNNSRTLPPFYSLVRSCSREHSSGFISICFFLNSRDTTSAI